MEYFVYPGTDIHLYRNPGTNNQIRFRIYDEGGVNITDLNVSGNPRVSYDGFSGSLFVSQAPGDPHTFSPVADGTVIGRMLIDDASGGNRRELLIRIVVHERLDHLAFGNKRASIHAGEKNFVLSVMAIFKDNTEADVSFHNYLNFNASFTAGATPNSFSVDGEGRLEGLVDPGYSSASPPSYPEAGKVAVTISGDPSVTDDVPVYVLPSLSNPNPDVVLKRIHPGSTKPESSRTGFLILGEGFPDPEKFNDYAKQLVTEFFKPKNSPFNRLSKSIDVWIAYEKKIDPDPVAGITIGNPIGSNDVPIPSQSRALAGDDTRHGVYDLYSIVGFPDGTVTSTSTANNTWGSIPAFSSKSLSQEVLDEWNAQRYLGFAEVKDTRLGLMSGTRFGERLSIPRPASQTPQEQWYLPRVPSIQLSPDRRRWPAHHKNSYWDFFERYLDSMRHGASGSKYYDVAKNWKKTNQITGVGKDQGLVVVLVNDELQGGTSIGTASGKLMIAISLGASNKISHNNDALILGRPVSHNFGKIAASLNSAIMAHEIGHNFGLGDEYTGFRHNDHQNLRSLSGAVLTEELEKINRHINLMGFDVWDNMNTLNFPPPATADAHYVKWNWPRVALSSTIVSHTNNLGTNRAIIDVPNREGSKWKAVRRDHPGTEVYLRTAELDKRIQGYDLKGPFTIESVSGNRVVLIPPSSGLMLLGVKFDPGDCMFIPGREGNRGENDFNMSTPIHYIIHKSVLTRIVTSGGTLTGTLDCSNALHEGQDPPFGMLLENGKVVFRTPQAPSQVVGIYEGGGTWNCGVFRPTGNSQMRNHGIPSGVGDKPGTRHSKLIVPFGYESKYYLVSRISPSILQVLDKKEFYEVTGRHRY